MDDPAGRARSYLFDRLGDGPRGQKRLALAALSEGDHVAVSLLEVLDRDLGDLLGGRRHLESLLRRRGFAFLERDAADAPRVAGGRDRERPPPPAPKKRLPGGAPLPARA